MMKRVMHWLFLSCLKATELIEKKLNFRLTTMEKLQLSMHKAMCDACSRYEKQSSFIDEAIASQPPDTPSDNEISLLKKKINTGLENPQH